MRYKHLLKKTCHIVSDLDIAPYKIHDLIHRYKNQALVPVIGYHSNTLSFNYSSLDILKKIYRQFTKSRSWP